MNKMFELVLNFPNQLKDALEICNNSQLLLEKDRYNKIIISGLGGSGIGGSIVNDLLKKKIEIPIIINRGYDLPNFADKNTLLILSSYSGTTEETVSVANQALTKGIKSIVISSGGELIELAKKNNLDYFLIPSGFPPRSCLGYSIVFVLKILYVLSLINVKWERNILNVSEFLTLEQDNLISKGHKVSQKINKNTIVAFGEDSIESFLIRFKQQINENSKLICYQNTIPEMNHNDLVGWRKETNDIFIIFFRTEHEYFRNKERINFTKNEILKVNNNLEEIWAEGKDEFQQMFYLIHFGDILSCILAEKGGFDAMEIDVLIRLKKHMADLR